MPVATSIVPTEAVELDHVPPADADVSMPPLPAQYASVPPMAAGAGLTVTRAVAMQPAAELYVIVLTPAVAPETTPPEVTEMPTADQVPPEGVPTSVMEPPEQKLSVPEIDANGNTVTVLVT